MEEKEIQDVEYIDYEKLKNEALNYLKKIGGEKWNYYDEHDPGITILENLCFAIMDLDYRINFPIEDLLAKNPKKHGEIVPFFMPEEILPSAPVTLNDYYKLTNHNEEELISGVRDTVEEDTNKKNKTDFVLWFTKSKFEDQELKWNSPWGLGYPGWHIECSCISLKYLGDKLDIHCGGVDNIFPHHTNEIAQTESYIGNKWCNYWFHVEHLNDSTGKMSKSKGEFLTIDLLESKGYNPLAYRLFCLGSHYKNQLVFTFESLDSSQNAYNKLINKIKSIKKDDSKINQEDFDKYNNEFKNALADNLNTSNALTVLYDVLKSNINNNTKLALVESFDKVLSLNLLKEEETSHNEELVKYIEEMILKRTEAKKNKNFELADSIRNELLSKGIVLKDTREGTTFEVSK